MTSKTSKDAKRAFTKLSYMFLSLPFYFRPIIKEREESKTSLEAAKPSENTKDSKKSRETNIDDFLNSLIDYESTTNGAYDSIKLNGYLGDECFKWEKPNDYIVHLGMIRPTMVPNGRVVGKAFLGSTMNAMDKGGSQGVMLIKQSQVKDRDPITQKTPSGLYFHFLPAHKNMEMFTDIYGYCHETTPPPGTLNWKGEPITIGSWDYLIAVEESFKGDDIALNEQYRTFPRTLNHALRDDATETVFNVEKIYNQIEYNSTLGKDSLYTIGNFEWKDGVRDTSVEFFPNPKGRFKVRWIPSEVDDTLHLRNNYREVNGKFYPLNDFGGFGCDPFSIKSTVGKGSKGGIHGLTKPNQDGVISNLFFLEYIARPPQEEIFFEDVIKACVFYGIQVLVESNRIDLLRYMRNRGYRPFAADRVDKPKNGLSENDKEYGGQVMSGKDMIDSHMNGIASYIEKYVGKSTNPAYRPEGEIGDMVFEETLIDWLNFNPDKRTEHDATISSGLAIMQCNRDKYKAKVIKKDIPEIGIFVKKFRN
jgi:hypothetical protein